MFRLLQWAWNYFTFSPHLLSLSLWTHLLQSHFFYEEKDCQFHAGRNWSGWIWSRMCYLKIQKFHFFLTLCFEKWLLESPILSQFLRWECQMHCFTDFRRGVGGNTRCTASLTSAEEWQDFRFHVCLFHTTLIKCLRQSVYLQRRSGLGCKAASLWTL